MPVPVRLQPARQRRPFVLAVQEAVEIQQASYALLKWLRDAVHRGFVRLETAHDYVTDSEAAAAWIAEHYRSLPPDARPPVKEGEPLRRFANFLSSYLATSYEFDRRPETRLGSTCGCWCWCCTYAEQAPHLRPRKVGRADKQKAAKLKRSFVEDLGARHRIGVSETRATRMLADATLSEQAAVGAYAVQLIRRCEGLPCGPEALALWREFAWTRLGSPKRKYRLSAGMIEAAQARLLEALRSPLKA